MFQHKGVNISSSMLGSAKGFVNYHDNDILSLKHVVALQSIQLYASQSVIS